MLNIIFNKNVLLRALIISIIVLILLAAINYGDCMIMGTMTTLCWIKVCITFCIPFLVSLVSSALAINKQSLT
jgi:hypothetical protein